MARTSPIQPQACRLAWLAFVLVLLAAQTLGLLHRQVHARALQVLPGEVSAASMLAEPATGALAKAFAGHQADNCRLLDQLCHSQPLPSAVLPTLPLPAVAGAPPLWRQNAPPPRRAVPFEARAPPAFR